MVTEVVNSTDVNFPKRKQAAFSHVQPLKKDDLGDMHNVPSEIHNSIQGQGVTSNKHRQLMKPWEYQLGKTLNTHSIGSSSIRGSAGKTEKLQ